MAVSFAPSKVQLLGYCLEVDLAQIVVLDDKLSDDCCYSFYRTK